MLEKQSISLGGENISYTLRRDRRAKHFRITVHPDGKCIITVPFYYRKSVFSQFLEDNTEWLQKKLQKKNREKRLLSGYYSRKEYLYLKERAREFILREIEECNRIYNFSYKKIHIRNQRSCWGSCSTQKNLNFHYKLFLLPKRLARYVIVHELCHLREMNHSSRFWGLVSQAIPDYKEFRKELKRW